MRIEGIVFMMISFRNPSVERTELMRFADLRLQSWNSGWRSPSIARSYRMILSASAALLLVMAAGCVISPRRDGTGGGTTPPPATGPGKLYVSNQSGNSILRFDNALAGTTTGNVAPITISQASQLSAPQGMALDTKNNRLFVTVPGGILVYDQVSTRAGTVSADRVITGFTVPVAVALDVPHDLLYVADLINIQVIGSASTANGAAAPVRTITPLVGGSGFSVAGILLDTTGDRLFVLDALGNAVNIYDTASGLNGGVTATRSLSGAATLLGAPQGAQIDSQGRLVVANNNPARVTIYANAASVTGNTAPTVTLTSTALSGPSNIVVTSGNELYVADGTAGAVPIFAGINAVASGAVTPARNITGAKTGLTGAVPTAVGIALDTTR
jgi:sugar lactone lactonase YvrE